MCDKAERPLAGAQVLFQVQLPSFERSEGLRIKSFGTVVRWGSSGERCGFALSASIDMERAEEDESGDSASN